MEICCGDGRVMTAAKLIDREQQKSCGNVTLKKHHVQHTTRQRKEKRLNGRLVFRGLTPGRTAGVDTNKRYDDKSAAEASRTRQRKQ